eukprot:2475823-Rhodomonas_salina.1
MPTTTSSFSDNTIPWDEMAAAQWFPWSKKIQSKSSAMGFPFILQISILNNTATRLKGLAGVARFLTTEDPVLYPDSDDEDEEEAPNEDEDEDDSEEPIKATPAKRFTMLRKDSQLEKRKIKFASESSGRILPSLPTRKLRLVRLLHTLDSGAVWFQLKVVFILLQLVRNSNPGSRVYSLCALWSCCGAEVCGRQCER